MPSPDSPDTAQLPDTPELAADPYLWLEEVGADAALDWVRAHNETTFADLAETDRYREIRAGILDALDADDRIPYVRRRGGHLFNFWQDADNPRGLWRRTTLDSYRTGTPAWEVLIDVDQLAEDEDENWVWKGAAVLRPDFRRALVELSRGGADATVVREYDLHDHTFVPDGFQVPEAKTLVDWIDEDHIFVGTDTGPGSLTGSGYPRVIRRWTRGTPLADAPVVFEGRGGDVMAYAHHDDTDGFERDVVGRRPDFFSSEDHVLQPDGTASRIEVPDDADIGLWRAWLLIRLRSPWTVAGTGYPAGSLLATPLDRALGAPGAPPVAVLFEPDGHTSLGDYAPTRHHLIISTLADVTTEMHVLTPPDLDLAGPDADPTAPWNRTPLPGVPPVGEATVVDTDPHNTDEYFLDSQSFTEPATLRRGVVGAPDQVEDLWRAPARFDAGGLDARQYFATSDDGTRVPYFVIGPDEPTGPALMTGYGGFEVPLTPTYSAVMGRGWLTRGGTYVVANIRGGGEYGPAWHQAALRENRHRAYEDFAAVARDLVDRRITTPGRLGIHGGSNGGLLMGVMLTRYPDLFGAIVCKVPLLDMARYHRLLAGASWMAEWGDPDVPEDWEFLRTYSPYHLVAGDGTYPPTLLVTSTRDDRVHPGHARKMMARMTEMGHDVRYYENIEGGHGAAADNDQAATMWALAFEFLWQQLG